jgi:hypothetical protein
MKKLKIWKLHSQSSKIEKANKLCLGKANKSGVRWCGPYSSANQLGFWVYPPVDMEIFYNGNSFSGTAEQYSNEDYFKIKSLIKSEDKVNIEKWCDSNTGRTKFTWGEADKNVVQIWTGLIFQTPPGYCLQIRSPINFPRENYHVMEAVLETDWMHYDIWINLICEPNKKISIKKDLPIAHLVPVKRESMNGWEIEEDFVNRKTRNSNHVFRYFIQYNRKKFEKGGNQPLTPDGSLTKDSTTYFKEKKKLLDGENKPRCPYHNFIGKFFPNFPKRQFK